jgi:hypothetical protein
MSSGLTDVEAHFSTINTLQMMLSKYLLKIVLGILPGQFSVEFNGGEDQSFV